MQRSADQRRCAVTALARRSVPLTWGMAILGGHRSIQDKERGELQSKQQLRNLAQAEAGRRVLPLCRLQVWQAACLS